MVDDDRDVEHESCTHESQTSSTGDSQFFTATTDNDAVLNRGISLEEFCITMSRLEIWDSKSYEDWFQEVGRWNGFPEFPATQFRINRIWREVKIAAGYLRLLNAIDKPLSAFE